MVLTIRTVYKASFYNRLLNKVKVLQYHIEPISISKLLELSGTYGFVLPNDKKLKEFLCTPFYLNLYLALENVEDEEKNALNREVFEEKIWEDISRNLLGYSLNFIVCFADVLLNCDRTERKVLIEAFIDRADINRNEHVQDLLKWLIIDQEAYGKKDEFWHVWELLKSKMIELGNEDVYGYYANCNVPFGKDRVITTYLFANSAWRKMSIDVISSQRIEQYFFLIL